MATLIGRFLNATKNANGTVTLEFGIGAPNSTLNLTVITLSSTEVTALSGVCTGGTGTKSSAVHALESNAPVGYAH